MASGGVIANRISRFVSLRTGLRIANGLAICGASAFMGVHLNGHVTMVTVVASIALFMVGAGMASPFAIAGAVSANPRAIGAASELYGFFQMGFGMLFTNVVETWSPGTVLPVAVILLASSLVSQIVLTWVARRG